MLSDLRGRARVLPDRVNTDYIIASTRKAQSLDPNVLKQWLLEGHDPDFAASVSPGDILVAGEAFGCGSAMEVAVTVVKAAGIKAVLARSFARTYYRNAINNGLVPVEVDTRCIRESDNLTLRFDRSSVLVTNESTGAQDTGRELPPFVQGILEEGGLVPYLKKHDRFLERAR